MPENQKSEVLLSYSGPLKYDTIGLLINKLKDMASGMGIRLVLYKKILLVMIESLENILKYNEHLDEELHLKKEFLPKFSIERLDDTFILTSSNTILSGDVSQLSEKLTLINSLNAEGLKKLYKTTITNGQFSLKGGAGLGFIEIAKIASEKMDFSFENINEKYSYYRLQVLIRDDNT
ncbi:MAG: SiaB family protein kinase [Bacteroidales bacterium]|nr:SiaB family protein kinase [Bacteroidales bacterium]